MAQTLGSTAYSSLSAGVIDLGNQLRALGVTSDIRLPTLVTAGNQSSGKSSVVEAIAGIPLPRSSGTCTRCPTDVRMRRAAPAGDAPWLCHIKIKREYDAHGHPLHEVPPEQAFCTITNKEHIAICVTAAQASLLNPGATAQEEGGALAFVPSGLGGGGGATPRHSDAFGRLGGGDYELEFTSNSVVLEIQGAEADLTIVDLPGIIQSHPKGEHYVGMIKEMVVRTIQQDHVIIAMVVTAMDDLENQAINLEARKVDPEGKRTIGIITKPDNIPDGEHGKWVSLARNQNPRQALTLGYYVVKNPGQTQLDEGMTFEEARQREDAFFRSDPHWSKVHGDIGSRLGTHRLRDALSEKLVELIQQQLPAMRTHTETKLKDVGDKIRKLPRKLGDDVQYEFQEMLRKVAERLSDEVHARNQGEKRSYQRYIEIYRRFEDAIKSSMPVFEVNGTIVRMTGTHDGEAPEHARRTLEQVKQLRETHLGSELPSFSPYSAVVALILVFKGQWKDAISSCLEEVKSELQTQLKDSLKELSQFPYLAPMLSNVMSDHLECEAQTCMERLMRLSDMEEGDTFTMNEEYFTDAEGKYLVRLKMANLGKSDWSEWAKSVEGNQDSELENDILGKLRVFGIACKSVEEIFLAQPTPEDNELKMMAATLAYYDVVYKRILDNVPLHIRDYFLYAFADKETLPRVIYAKIKEGVKHGGAGLPDLLREDAATDNNRRQLQDSKARLGKALQMLQHPGRRVDASTSAAA